MTADLDRQLEAYTAAVVAYQVPITAAEAQALVGAIRELPVAKRKPVPVVRRGVLVAVMAAAVIVVVLAVPILLSGASQEGPPANPSTATTLSVPTTAVPSTIVDQDLNSGTGTVSWTEYDAAPALDPIRIVGPRSGFTALNEDSSGFSLWTTDDGVNWTESAVPPMDSESANLHSTASGLWLSGDDSLDWLTRDDPLELWHSADLIAWERVDLGDSIDAPFGLWWETSIDEVASVGNVTIVSLELRLEFDWAAILGIDPGAYDDFPIVEFDEARTDETDVYAVTRLIEGAEDSELLVAEIRFVSDQDGLLLLDNTTGDEIIFFPRGKEGEGRDTTGDPRFALNEGGWGSSREALLMVGLDGARTIDPEIGASAPFEYCWQTLTEVDGQVLVAVCDEDGAATTFLTSDGVTWNDGPSIPPLANRDYDPDSGYWYGFTWGSGGSTHWISSSGTDWTMLNPPTGQDARLLRLDGGWVVAGVSGDFFFSSDGEVWSTSADGPSGFGPLALGNSLVVFGEDTTWVGVVTFD